MVCAHLTGQAGQIQWLDSAAPTIASLFSEGAKGRQMFESAMSAINMPYQIPNVQVETAAVEAHARIGWFRSVANIPHVFAAQCFIDELAHKAGKDSRDFALDLIGPARRIDPSSLADTWNYSESPERYPYDTGRLRGVIEAACKMEGGAIMGLSLALTSEIRFEKGRVKQSNFHDYEVLRHNASPRVIRTHLVNDDHALPPGGVGDSIARGVGATQNAAGWLILPGDLPLIDPGSLRRVAQALASKPVVVPS